MYFVHELIVPWPFVPPTVFRSFSFARHPTAIRRFSRIAGRRPSLVPVPEPVVYGVLKVTVLSSRERQHNSLVMRLVAVVLVACKSEFTTNC